jgi:hypothetical protein
MTMIKSPRIDDTVVDEFPFTVSDEDLAAVDGGDDFLEPTFVEFFDTCDGITIESPGGELSVTSMALGEESLSGLL